MKSKILIIIPARGGSKGIPRKNLRILNGYPLIYYTIMLRKTKAPFPGPAQGIGAIHCAISRKARITYHCCGTGKTERSRGHRQSEPETAALAYLTLDLHLTAVSLNQVPGDGQTQARAAS